MPEGTPRYEPRTWVVLFDTSGSRTGADLVAQKSLLKRLLHEWDEDDSVAVIAFDAQARPWPQGLGKVRDVSLDKLDQWLTTEATNGLGETRMEEALAAAQRLLRDYSTEGKPCLVYLGDGIVTGGEKRLSALRSEVSKNAKFISLAVGDRTNAPLLRGLAEATGGMYVAVNSGDDLAWRAFDVVAALNTRRIIDLRGTLQDAQGHPIAEAQTYLLSKQLSGGQSAVLVARYPTGNPARKLELYGQSEGDLWSTTVPLPGLQAERGGKASNKRAKYLPRLWARRRIAALVRQGAVEHHDEIVKLGLEHFLITPFTSLLVLENDQMYRRFKVSRAVAHPWARYELPKRIEDKVEPLGAGPLDLYAGGTGVILRTPLPLFNRRSSYRAPRYRDLVTETTVRKHRIRGLMLEEGVFSNVNTDFHVDVKRFDSDVSFPVGLGGIGAIGAGTGTGQAFGSGRRRVRSTRRSSEVGKGGGVRAGADPSSRESLISQYRTVVTTAQLRRHEVPRWQRGGEEWIADGLTKRHKAGESDKKGLKTTGRQGRPPLPALAAETTIRRSGVFSWFAQADDFAPFDGEISGRTWPVYRYLNQSDVLDDLTEYVPAMFADEVDLVAESLVVAANQSSSAIAADAGRLLAAAAGRQERQYRLDNGAILRIDEKGRYELRRVLSTGLQEREVYDGNVLHTVYPELQLVVKRPIGVVEPFLYAHYLPFVVSSSDKLAGAYQITKDGERTLLLEPVGGQSGEQLRLKLDENHRVIGVHHKRAEKDVLSLRLQYQGESVRLIRPRGKPVTMTAQELSGRLDFNVPEDWTVVAMPLQEPAHWQSKLAEEKPGSSQWRSIQAQLLASYAALGDGRELNQGLSAIRQHNDRLNLGELVLASGGVSSVQKRKVLDEIARPLGKQPVVQYLDAVWRLHHDNKFEPFATLSSIGGLVGTLARFRSALRKTDLSDEREAFSSVEALRRDSFHPPFLFYLAYRLSERFRWEGKEAVFSMWDGLATVPTLKLAATAAAARECRYTYGRKCDAPKRYRAALEQAVSAGRYPVLNGGIRSSVSNAQGEIAFRVLWVWWRDQLLSSGKSAALVSLARSVRNLGYLEDYQDIGKGLSEASFDDPVFAERAVVELLALNWKGSVWPLLAPHVAGRRGAQVLELASFVEERNRRWQSAADLLAGSMALNGQPIGLDRLRGQYLRLFALRLAQADTEDLENAEGLDNALAVANQWRREDPDNPDIDRLCATVLYEQGMPKRAWRQLSSIIERHPAEGDAYQRVANELEAQDRFAQAEGIWKKAAEVEPTNPRWLLRRAQLLSALGRRNEAKPLFQRVADGKWQDRFRDAVRTAQQALGK